MRLKIKLVRERKNENSWNMTSRLRHKVAHVVLRSKWTILIVKKPLRVPIVNVLTSDELDDVYHAASVLYSKKLNKLNNAGRQNQVKGEN